MKFKVGDKVRVKNNLFIGREYAEGGCFFINCMDKYRGSVAKIIGAGSLKDDRYRLDIDREDSYWSNGMLEKYTTQEVDMDTEKNKKKVELYEEDLIRAYDKGCADVREVLEGMFPSVFGNIVKVGDRFTHGENVYILSRAGDNRIILICLETGNLWSVTVQTENDCYITRKEWEEVQSSEVGGFKKI